MRQLILAMAVFGLLTGETAAAAELELDWGLSVGPNLDANILVGETIRWTWIDSFVHTVTSTSGPTSFDSGFIAGFGSTYSQTFTQEGMWDYVCIVHGGLVMGGVITVPEPAQMLLLLAGVPGLAGLARLRRGRRRGSLIPLSDSAVSPCEPSGASGKGTRR